MVVQIVKVMFPLSRLHVTKSFPLMRFMSSLSSDSSVRSLLYKEYGEPVEVLQFGDSALGKLEGNQVLVKWLLSPVNPADINTIQGKYPSKPPLPAVPGNEGVGEVVAVGTNVQNFSIGDRVLPNGNNLGTWRTKGNYKAEDLLKVPSDIDPLAASVLKVNPCTAYRMLRDFVQLKPGDTVIQNGGNSAVGQIVIQLCRIWDYKTVSVVRDRPDILKLKEQLKELGANEVLTEDEARKTDLFKSKKLAVPKLALNCVSGQNALEVSRQLANGGVMVTYGGMSREPVTVPTASLIFKDLTFKGFWMSAWYKKHYGSKEQIDMINEIAQLFKEKKLVVPPHKLVPLNNYREAIVNTLNAGGKTGLKYILDMTNV
ncbi:enoyl-[acyl-carrier-protein] reductase, mitochondrial [Orussus abietinus]|uniref:enoyl-[acyl-carrier-protein] reductase, mitochondrial n=1 Tax=Orussus abietinus TaxID=222816 RepID=UPI000625A849|nr:enoyl-[acyl-carrier-protein] reductase, mitochondrial [Orussus abietinus]